MSNRKLKSAYELAMERLSSKDPGLAQETLSEDVKKKISDIRAEYEAKMAEREIMFKSKVAELFQELAVPDAMLRRTQLEAEHRTAIEVLRKTQNDKIRKVRGQE